MNKTLIFSVIITSVILVSGTLGFVLNDLDAFAQPATQVTICHVELNPPNEQTLTVGIAAAVAHILQHPGDSYLACGATPTTCEDDCLNRFTTTCGVNNKQCIRANELGTATCLADC